MLLDLDCFEDIDDALGYDVGDELLVRVGQRFAAAQGLRAALEEPIEVGSASLQVDVSIGIALTPANGTDLSLLMRKADVAMFRASPIAVGTTSTVRWTTTAPP